MNEYLMIFRNAANETTPTPDQMKTAVLQWQKWIGDIVRNGRYSGTNRLLRDGKTVRSGKVVTDGPYAESKELVGGYLLVKAASIDDAVEMAHGCPGLLYGGNVEVRSVMPIEYDANASNFLEEKVHA